MSKVGVEAWCTLCHSSRFAMVDEQDVVAKAHAEWSENHRGVCPITQQDREDLAAALRPYLIENGDEDEVLEAVLPIVARISLRPHGSPA